MSSPVKLDGSKFQLPACPKNRFQSLGQQRGNKGITHSVFQNRTPIHPLFFVGPPFEISGYCSYRLLYNENQSILCGVVFISFASKTTVSDISLVVGATTLPEAFEPSFILESSGILIFKCVDSSILAIPSVVESPLLVTID
jgi:hypothetical protein